MEIEERIREWKIIYSSLLDFVESLDDSNDKFQQLKDILIKSKVFQKKEEFLELIQLISRITDNHYRPHDFIDKIERMLIEFFKNIQFSTSISEIIQVKDINKLILFIILDKKIIIVDPTDNVEKKAVQSAVEQNKALSNYLDYLSPFLSSYIDDINPKLVKISKKEENYLQKCRTGVNDDYVCSLIRDDLADSFITYINEKSLSPSSQIKRSCYETNVFLMCNETSYIEYAAFYGSIQIFQYLINNNVKMTEKLWYYAIHSQNSELIQLLIDKIPLKNYDNILIESIKCHHNEISVYIKETLMMIQNDEKLSDNFGFIITYSRNFFFYPDEISYILEKPRNYRCINISDLISSLTTLTIPTSVTKIGDFVFKECFTLNEVVFHSSIKSVGIGIFDGLKSIKISGEIENVLNDLFTNNTSLEKVILAQSLTEIGDGVFNGCSSLKYVSILSKITSIRGYIFRFCSSLKEVVLPQSLTEIGDDVFNGCSSLEKISIPKSCTLIGSSCFMYCSSLKEITIPESVTEIKRNTFYDCKSLQKITIPSTVTFIGDSAFNGCLKLEEINIPSYVNYIGEFAFSRCHLLTEISIPASLSLIKNHCFSSCKSLKSIKITKSDTYSVTSIERNAFYGCSSLIQFDMPSSVTELGEYAFSGCSSLESIKLSPSLKSINDFTFNGCTSLREIENIPEILISIGNSAFKNCSSLVNLKIPSTVTDIGESAFYGCSSLTEIEFPLNLTSIKHSTFRNNESLEEIKIPSSIKSIGMFSFYGCTSLKHIKVPSSIEDTSFIESEFVDKIVKFKK